MKREVKERIDELANRPEGLDYRVIVAEIKRKDSPLHDLVEWDKSAAHEIYLADCAREIIRDYWIAVNQTTDSGESKVTSIRKYHSLPVGNDEITGRQIRRYYSIERIQGDKVLMSLALQQALDDLTAFRIRYQYLQELSGLIVVIDKTIRAHKPAEGKRSRAS
jgi:hypothetical protein